MTLEEIKTKIEELQEEAKKLECVGSDKLTEAEEDEEVEVTEDESETEEAPIEDVTDVMETEEDIVEEPVEEPVVIDDSMKNLLRTCITDFEATNETLDIALGELASDEKVKEVINGVKEDVNAAIGKMRAIVAKDNEDVVAQDEARAEAEEILNDDVSHEEADLENKDDEGELEVIKPIDIDDETEEKIEVSDEDVEEVEESLNESVSVTEEVDIGDFPFWGPAVDHFDYIYNEAGSEIIEEVLRDTFGYDYVFNKTELNDFFAYYYVGSGIYIDEDEFYELFGLKNPYAEDEEEDEEVEEDEDIEEGFDCDNPDDCIDEYEEITEAKSRFHKR